jgi:uncharacterized membrane protein (UPF0182 family)
VLRKVSIIKPYQQNYTGLSRTDEVMKGSDYTDISHSNYINTGLSRTDEVMKGSDYTDISHSNYIKTGLSRTDEVMKGSDYTDIGHSNYIDCTELVLAAQENV